MYIVSLLFFQVPTLTFLNSNYKPKEIHLVFFQSGKAIIFVLAQSGGRSLKPRAQGPSYVCPSPLLFLPPPCTNVPYFAITETHKYYKLSSVGKPFPYDLPPPLAPSTLFQAPYLTRSTLISPLLFPCTAPHTA